jgi:copper homeostasis protein
LTTVFPRKGSTVFSKFAWFFIILSVSKKILVEVCCESLFDVNVAVAVGAHRIELNSALRLGGLTPSLGLLSLVAQRVSIPVITMVRPRESGFCYSAEEFRTMEMDARILLENGAGGLAFGILKPDGNLDMLRASKLVNLAKEFGAQTVLHRAFDFIPCWKQAIDQCLEIGFDRIMTSGGAENALAGITRIREIISYANDQIEVLPAGGISPGNVKQLIAETGCTQIHGSFSETILDPTVAFFDGTLTDVRRDICSYRAASREITKKLISSIQN